jgi:hypothetical protein
MLGNTWKLAAAWIALLEASVQQGSLSSTYVQQVSMSLPLYAKMLISFNDAQQSLQVSISP